MVFCTGLTGSQVMPLLPLMLSLQLDSARMVQAVNIAVTTASGFMAIALLAGGMMSLPGLGGSIAAVIPAMAGIYLGVKLRSLIPDASFKRLVLMIFGCIGVALMMRA